MDEKIRRALAFQQPDMPDQPDVEDDEEDDRCDLNPSKICDNCMMCVTGGADFRAVTISGIELDDEQPDKQ